MKRIMHLSVCCLLWNAGCQSTERLAGEKPGPRDSIAETRSDQAAGLPAPSQKSVPPASLPNTADQHAQLGQSAVASWYRDRQPDQLATARMHFEEALRQSPQHARAHHGLGIVADLERKFEEAERHYLFALSQSPNDSDVLGDLGYSYLLQQRLPEAERHLLRAVAANPRNTNANKHLGDVYARQGKTDLARQTYEKVLAPDAVQQALADNAPQRQQPAAATANAPAPAAVAQHDKSFLDRLMPPSKSKAEEFAEDLQRRKEELRHQQGPAHQQAVLQQPSYGRPPRGDDPQRIKDQLHAIDRERYAHVSDGPILIDDQTGRATRLPGAELASTWDNGTAAAFPSTVLDASQRPQQRSLDEAPQPPAQTRGGQPSQPAPRDLQPWSGAQPAERYAGLHQPERQPAAQAARSPHQAGSPQGPGGPYDPRSWNAPPQVHGSLPVSYEPDVATRPEAVSTNGGFATQAQFLTPNAPQPGPPAPGQSTPPQSPWNGAPYAFPQAALTPPANTPGGDPFQEASKQAARMGMGLGPGAMFPVFPNAPGVDVPGSSSFMNGDQAPQAQRFLPTDAPVRDLRQAFRPDPAMGPPPQSSVGGQLPPMSAPMYSQEQFGTRARFDTQTLQQADVPPSMFTNQQVQGYERQRQDANRELTQAMSQVWGQGPMNSTIVPVGTGTHQVPAPPGISYTQQTSNDAISPPPWPHLINTPQTQAAFERDMQTTPQPPQTQFAQQQQQGPGVFQQPDYYQQPASYQPQVNTYNPGWGGPPPSASQQYGDHVVVPPTYRPAERPSAPAGSAANGMPAIRPATR